MMKYWKQIGVALAACLLLVLMAFPAMAAGGQYGAFTYELKGNGTAVITKFDWDKHEGGDVYVPRSIDGYNVTEIGPMAFTGENPGARLSSYDRDISKSNAPYGESVAIVLPDTITVIAEKAFFWTNITACDIPASVQLIGPGAFAGCPNIRQFSVNSRNTTFAVIDGVLFNKVKKELIAFPLSYVKKEYAIPNGIRSIGDYAFYALGRDGSYISVSNVVISFPSTVTTVGDYAFYGAGYTYSNVIGNNSQIQHVGDYAFAYAYGVGGFAPSTIGEYAFYECYLYEDLSLANLTSLGKYAFAECDGLKYHMTGFDSSKITSIPPYAFSSSSLPSSLTLPATVTEIGEYAFNSTSGDTAFTIPASVTTIEKGAFSDSHGRIIFADGSRLTTIGDQAFYNFRFTQSSELTLPAAVENLGEKAFYYDISGSNYALTLLIVPESVTEIGSDVVNRTKTVMQVTPGSYADIWASENGYPMQVDDTSWLLE